MIFSLSFNFEFDQFLTYSQQLVISPYQHTHTHTQPQLYTDRKKTFFFFNFKASSWDNTKHIIQWVDQIDHHQPTSQSDLPVGDASTNQAPILTSLPGKPKKKVVTIEQEPAFTSIAGSSLDLDLFVSTNCNYAKLKCSTNRIYFKETFMLDTRYYRFVLKNS